MATRHFLIQGRRRLAERLFRLAFLVLLVAGCQSNEPAQDKESTATPTPPAATVQEKAGVGVGEKGRGYGGGPVTTPVAAYFAVRERLVFDVQIPHAMNIYKATEGHTPWTHDEFMRDIITANQIRLPTLPEGHRYIYDPKSGQLMVEHPRQ